MPILVDTNILIYAINADSPKCKSAQKFLKENVEHLVVSHQNIFEAIRVLTHPRFPRPMKPNDATTAILAILGSSRIIAPDQRACYLALELIKNYSLAGNRVFDAYLTATALSHDVRVVATDNVKHFQLFPIKIINPFA